MTRIILGGKMKIYTSLLVFIIAVFSVSSSSAQGNSSKFPNKPIRFVVPFPPGGGNDILARTIAPKMAELLGQSIVIDNKAGAGGNVGTEMVARAAPDGYTILMASNQITINPWMYSSLPFDIEKDFSPVALVASVPMLLTVNPLLPANDLREFIALAKAKPGSLNYCTPGAGTPQNIAFEVFNFDANIKIVHIPYKGTGPCIADLIGGQVQATIGTMASLEQHIKAGKLRPLGVTTLTRSPISPDIPTISEVIPGYTSPLWYSVLAPSGTPKDIVAVISTAIAGALADSVTKERLASQSFVINYMNPQKMTDLIKTDLIFWKKEIANINLKID